MKLNVKAFALACGLLWGIGLFVLTWWLIALDESVGQKTWLGKFYLGYRITPLGSVSGLVWALVDGLIGGAVFAWVYNAIAARTTKPTEV